VVIGAQLDIHIFLKSTLFLVVGGYLLARSTGKIFGAMLGGIIARAKPEVTKNAGMALFTQGGVAVGLALSISHNIARAVPGDGETIGIFVMNVVAATTFVVQLIGPAFVKLAVFRSGENNKDINREDVINALKVKDVMQTDFIPVSANASLPQIISAIKEEGTFHSPVVNARGEHIGSISLNALKEALYEEELKDLLLAEDIAIPDVYHVTQDRPLYEAMDILEERYIDYLPVFEDESSHKVVGLLEHPHLIQVLNRKVLEGQIQQ